MPIPVAPVEHVQLLKAKYSKKSGSQSLSPSRAEHASQQAVSGSFCGSYALVFACFASCLLCPWGGGVTLGMFPQGSEDTLARRWLRFKGDATPSFEIVCFALVVEGVLWTFYMLREGCTICIPEIQAQPTQRPSQPPPRNPGEGSPGLGQWLGQALEPTRTLGIKDVLEQQCCHL